MTEKQEAFLKSLEKWEIRGKKYDFHWHCKQCRSAGTQRTVGIMQGIVGTHADHIGFFFRTLLA